MFLEAISIQKLTVKCNRLHEITACRDKDIIRTNLQQNRYIFNQIRHIKAIWNKLISLPTTPATPDHIGDVVKTPLRYEWCDSIFSNHEKMSTSTTFSAPFLLSSLPPETNIFRSRIYFRLKTTDIYNQPDLYSIKCAYGPSIIEGFDFNSSYAHVAGILSLCIIIEIAYTEGLVIFVLYIYNAFQNNILPYSSEIVYLILPYLYLDWYKIKVLNIY